MMKRLRQEQPGRIRLELVNTKKSLAYIVCCFPHSLCTTRIRQKEIESLIGMRIFRHCLLHA